MYTQGIHALTILMVAFILLEFIFELVLDIRNNKSWGKPIPTELEGIYDAEKYKKAQAYHKEGGRLSLISGSLATLISVLFLVLKGFAWLHLEVTHYVSNPVLQTLVYFGALSVAGSILGLPFDIYST